MTPWSDLMHVAEQMPDAYAVSVDDAGCTYRELRERAENVARSLTVLGVEPDDRVTLHMANGVELPSAFYGCFGSGPSHALWTFG